MDFDEDKRRPARKKMLTPNGRVFWTGVVVGVLSAVIVPKMSWSGVADAGAAVWRRATSINITTDEEPAQVQP